MKIYRGQVPILLCCVDVFPGRSKLAELFLMQKRFIRLTTNA